MKMGPGALTAVICTSNGLTIIKEKPMSDQMSNKPTDKIGELVSKSGQTLNDLMNGKDCPQGERQYAYVLFALNFNGPGKLYYSSNIHSKLELSKLLHQEALRFEEMADAEAQDELEAKAFGEKENG